MEASVERVVETLHRASLDANDAQNATTSSSDTPAVDAIRPTPDRALRLGLVDGRDIVGKFACYDKQQNILLVQAREHRKAAASTSERSLGTVIVPWKWVRTCHSDLPS